MLTDEETDRFTATIILSVKYCIGRLDAVVEGYMKFTRYEEIAIMKFIATIVEYLPDNTIIEFNSSRKYSLVMLKNLMDIYKDKHVGKNDED